MINHVFISFFMFPLASMQCIHANYIHRNSCYNSCSKWDTHTSMVWTKKHLGKGPHNIMCHTWFSYLEIISCNMSSLPFLKEKQLGKSNSNLDLVYRSKRKIIAYSYVELIQIDSAICSVSISVHVKSFPRKIKQQSEKSKPGDLIKSVWKRQSALFDCLSSLFTDLSISQHYYRSTM